jgi:type IV secretory pathway VirB2 component (pilin)
MMIGGVPVIGYTAVDGDPAPVPCATDTVCIRNPLEFESLEALLNAIIDFLIKIGAPLAVIMIIYAGLVWMFAAGAPEKISKARSIIIWTIVGYSIILVAKGILLVIESVLGIPPAP